MRFKSVLFALLFAGCATTQGGSSSSKFAEGDCLTPSESFKAQVPPQVLDVLVNKLETKVEVVGTDYYVLRETLKADRTKSKVDLGGKAEIEANAEKGTCQ